MELTERDKEREPEKQERELEKRERELVRWKNRERRERIKELYAELKELTATPRSDWHSGFEAILKIDTHKYGDKVAIRVEHTLGEEPPRIDFVILVNDGGVAFDKEIFWIFKKFNIIEYKNPGDTLDEKTIRKMIGYVNFFIALSDKGEGVTVNDVTASIFRSAKPVKLFAEMEKAGTFEKTETSGIYLVKNLTDFPFQIVITGELKGDEYSAYRTLKKNAKREDVKRVIAAGDAETDGLTREHYRVLMNLVTDKNRKLIEGIRKEGVMTVLDIYKEEVDEIANERADERVKEADERWSATMREERRRVMDNTAAGIRNIMSQFKATLEQAMDVLNVPENERDMYVKLVNG